VLPVDRLSGLDRFETSAAVSAANFSPGVPVVYLASGAAFPDALSGAPVAGKKGTGGAPVLLVSQNGVPPSVAAELARLRPRRIVILGGTGAVGASVEKSVQAYTAGTVSRISGADRYATSARISAVNFTPGVPVVYVANGRNFPDALSGAPVAGANGAPVLLVTATGIPASVQTELKRLTPGRVVVLGGTGAVSSVVEKSLGRYAAGGVTRLSGADRFATSAAISRLNFVPGVPVLYIANGSNFPDALSGAPIAGANKAPVLLVSATSIPAAIAVELGRLKPGHIVVLGGTGSISAALALTLADYIP
jgi:putative cell wall-binding protein